MRLENNPTSFIISTISISRVIFLLVKLIFLQDKKYSPALYSVICPVLIEHKIRNSWDIHFFCEIIKKLKIPIADMDTFIDSFMRPSKHIKNHLF